MSLSYALSISHFVSSVGADAGFAALLGLAILVLLYFAQARETSTLRKQLVAATQRLEEFERRAAGSTSVPVAPRPPVSSSAAAAAPQPSLSSAAPAAAPATIAAGPVSAPAVAPRPAFAQPRTAPAGVGAPALSDATRVVPSTDQLATDRGTSVTDGGQQGGLGKTPSPVTAAGGNGSAARVEVGAPVAARSLLEHGIPDRRLSARWFLPLVGALVAAAVAVVLVLVLTGSGSPHRAVVHKSHPAVAAAPRGVVPSAVTVAVVNGTSVNQLAHHVGERLARLGFKEGTLATASNQSRSTTVTYLPGHRKDAFAVAHALRLMATVVTPVSGSIEGLVCQTSTACTADVIVVAGPNLAGKA